MLKRMFCLLIFVIISSFIFGCAGNDEILEEGVVKFVGSVSVKSQGTDANGEKLDIIEYANRDGIYLTLSRETKDGAFVPVDTTTSKKGKFTLVGDEYGSFRISARINDFIRVNHPVIAVSEDSAETYTLESPVTFGAYEELDTDSLRCDLPKPNPASTSTSITYVSAILGYVSIDIFNTSGTLIKSILENKECLPEVADTIEWDFRDNNNNIVPNDIYFFVFKWVKSEDPSVRKIHVGTIVKE